MGSDIMVWSFEVIYESRYEQPSILGDICADEIVYSITMSNAAITCGVLHKITWQCKGLCKRSITKTPSLQR